MIMMPSCFGCVSKVAETFSAMSDAYVSRSTTNVVEVVRDEVKKAVSESFRCVHCSDLVKPNKTSSEVVHMSTANQYSISRVCRCG